MKHIIPSHPLTCKIKASNMRDMIKWGAAFDAKVSQAEAMKVLAAAAPAKSKEDTIQELMQAAAGCFVPEKAGDWTAVLHFDIADGGQHTMTVKDGKCTVTKGLVGEATCKVNAPADTFIGMASGEVDGNQAFMAGKVKATSMRDMIKYGTSFDAKKSLAAAKAILSGGGEVKGESKEIVPQLQGMNKALIGKVYKGAPVMVSPAMAINYEIGRAHV